MTADGFIDNGINHGLNVFVKTYDFKPMPAVDYSSIWSLRILLMFRYIIGILIFPFAKFGDYSISIILRDWVIYITIVNYVISSLNINKLYNLIPIGMMVIRIIKTLFTLENTQCFEYCLERSEFVNNNCETAEVTLGTATSLIGNSLTLDIKDFDSTLNYTKLVEVCSRLHIIPESLPKKGKFRFIRFINNQEENRCLYLALKGFNLFKPLHYTMYGPEHPLNHVSTQPFPGSKKTYPILLMLHLRNKFYKNLDTIICSANHETGLPPLNYKERLEALNKFIEKRPPSNNRDRLKFYLTNCVNWYHGKKYTKSATVEYKKRWQFHVEWILGSAIKDSQITFFKRNDVERVYEDKAENRSMETIDPPSLEEHNRLLRDGKSIQTAFLDNSIIVDYKVTKTQQEVKKEIFRHRPTEPRIKGEINPNNLDKKKRPKMEFRGPCTCGEICKFSPVQNMGANRLKEVKEAGFLNEIDVEAKHEERQWTVVTQKTVPARKRMYNQSPFNNYYAVLTVEQPKHIESIPPVLTPYPEDYITYKKSSRKKKKSLNKNMPNQMRSSKIKRVFANIEPEPIKLETAIKQEFNKKPRQNEFSFANYYRTSVERCKNVARIYKKYKLASLGPEPEIQVDKEPIRVSIIDDKIEFE